MAQDSIKIEILDDGTIKITTDPISSANHKNADQLMEFFAKMTGGPVTVTKRKEAGLRQMQTRTHTHGHSH